MALLADVKQNPDDLTPWLVLCDWLEDRDDEAERARGEYCRLCFDKLGTKTYASDWEKGERRRHLYRTYHETWLGPILPLKPQIVKGLLEVSSDEVLDHVEAMASDPEAWAWVGTLEVGEGIEELMSPKRGLERLVAGLRTLDITTELSDREVATLASWPFLRKVRVLKLDLPKLNIRKARHLIESLQSGDIQILEVDLSTWYHQTPTKGRTTAIEALREAFGDRLTLFED